MESWVVRNKSGKTLFLTKNNILFKRDGDAIDLVARTGKRIDDLEFDKEIKINFSYNNLVTVSKVREEKVMEIPNEIDEKLNKLLDAVASIRAVENVEKNDNSSDINKILSYIKDMKINGVSNEIDVDQEKNEEKLREDFLKQLMENKKAKEEDTKMDNFGKNKRQIDSDEDFTDLIDF